MHGISYVLHAYYIAYERGKGEQTWCMYRKQYTIDMTIHKVVKRHIVMIDHYRFAALQLKRVVLDYEEEK
jgi:hypothetical protein